MKTESTDIFHADFTNCITSFTKTIALKDLYIYIKLGKKLGLAIDSKAHVPAGGKYEGIFMLAYDKDYQVTITLYGSIEYMEKLKTLWVKLDLNSIIGKLEKLLLDEFDKIEIG